MRTDSEIQRDVEKELEWDPDIDARNIAVKVTDGVVAVTGFVWSSGDTSSAVRIATRFLGGKAVASALEVKIATGSERPDPDIARDAVERLQRNLPYSSKNIKVTVRNSWITLEGDVDWDFQRREAEAAVRYVKGAKGVTNLIHVKPTVSATDVKTKIEQAFKRSAEVDASHITVEADGGKVILRGRVRSWAEKEEAEKAAWRSPGVYEVVNEIRVDPALQETRAFEDA